MSNWRSRWWKGPMLSQSMLGRVYGSLQGSPSDIQAN